MKWKNRLLSSGVPLEYRISKLLAAHNFSVASEYKYIRVDSGHQKEFSVDIAALSFTPFNDENECDCSVHILVECKHRHERKAWCFFPDVNKPEYSNFTLGRTIRIIDEFSYSQISHNSAIALDENRDCCFKGVEIDFSNNSVTDSGIKEGLSQLQYALPRLLIESALYGELQPIFIVPILVTSCNIYLFNDDVTDHHILTAQSIDDLAQERDSVLVTQDIGPDFYAYCARTVSNFSLDLLDRLEFPFKKLQYQYEHRRPENILKGLTQGEHSYLISILPQNMC